MTKNFHGHTELPEMSKMQHQAASITSKVSGSVSPCSDFASDKEILLAGYTLLTTNTFERSAGHSYASY